jgi:hypothetical protein
MSEGVNRNGHRNGSYYHSAGVRHEIENESVADVVDHYLQSHCGAPVGGKDGCLHGRLNKWVSVAPNGGSEKMLVKKGSYLTIGMTIVDVRYVRWNDEKRLIQENYLDDSAGLVKR